MGVSIFFIRSSNKIFKKKPADPPPVNKELNGMWTIDLLLLVCKQQLYCSQTKVTLLTKSLWETLLIYSVRLFSFSGSHTHEYELYVGVKFSYVNIRNQTYTLYLIQFI